MTSIDRPSQPGRTSAWTVIGVLLLFAPLLVPVLLVLALCLLFLGAIVVQAFQQGFVEGCAALAALIGIPSVAMLWLSKVIPVLVGRRETIPPAVRTRVLTDVEERYRSAEVVHRDSDAERREYQAEKRAREGRRAERG